MNPSRGRFIWETVPNAWATSHARPCVGPVCALMGSMIPANLRLDASPMSLPATGSARVTEVRRAFNATLVRARPYRPFPNGA